jgi:hypothetical protein
MTKIKRNQNIREPVTCASRLRGKVHKIELGGNIANAITTINTDSMVAIPIGYEREKKDSKGES